MRKMANLLKCTEVYIACAMIHMIEAGSLVMVKKYHDGSARTGHSIYRRRFTGTLHLVPNPEQGRGHVNQWLR